MSCSLYRPISESIFSSGSTPASDSLFAFTSIRILMAVLSFLFRAGLPGSAPRILLRLRHDVERTRAAEGVQVAGGGSRRACGPRGSLISIYVVGLYYGELVGEGGDGTSAPELDSIAP